MKTVMHINRRYGSPRGRVKTFCGVVLAAGEGAPLNAPICQACAKRAGWPATKR